MGKIAKSVVWVLVAFLAVVVILYGYNLTKANTQAKQEVQMDKPTYRRIDADEAKRIMDSNKDAVILDVRTTEEYRSQRIEGAVLIPDYEISKRAKTELPDKDKVILVYCRSGSRSRSAASTLVAMGYKNVYDFGGIISYPYETVSD